MKCRVHYDNDGESLYFDIDECAAEICHEKVMLELAARGLEDRLDSIRIDVSWPVVHKAMVFMIPCWYNEKTGELQGRNFVCGLLLGTVKLCLLPVSAVVEYITGRGLRYRIVMMD
ncbi:MAG TPA: hypothetical protein PK514_06040 [Spirochaetota bacterium]|nr:hypothetical protein [Spirochaetota bacterium]